MLLLTEAALPELTDDDDPLREAFASAGWQVRPAVWSDPIVDADLALIRSTWDYTSRAEEFLARLDEIALRMPLWNPAATVRWNADKRYLMQLADAGIPVPATTMVPRGSTTDLADVLQELASDEVVIKPLVGAGGYRTWRAGAGDEVAWAAAIQTHDLLVQRYLPEVASEGEWSLVFLAGSYSHAVIKLPAGGEFRVQQQHGGTWRVAQPGTGLVAAAERVLAAIPHPWQYARIDGIQAGGQFVLMEAELIEPQLFLPSAPGSAERLVAGLT